MIVVKNAKWSDPGGEEAQGSPLQLELRSPAQRTSCSHLSGLFTLAYLNAYVMHICILRFHIIVGHLGKKTKANAESLKFNTSTAERQHGDWKHERQRIGHMYGGTWVSCACFLFFQICCS